MKSNFRQIITKKSEILTFGKYKYKTVQHILRTEPSYILWLHEEKIVKFPQGILDNAEDSVIENDDYGNYPELHFGDR